MKKIVSLLLIMILFLSGCSIAEKYSLGNNNWKFSRVVQNQTGAVVFSSEKESSKYTTAKVIDISCTADDNKITLKDNATNNEWVLEYTKNKTAKTNNTDGTIFDITYATEDTSIKGHATTGVANLNDVSGNDYLIITIGGYELHFIDNEELELV